ncbi:MAG: hypothetical protein E6H72_09280, partial [Betaproteobacteria bacterium]
MRAPGPAASGPAAPGPAAPGARRRARPARRAPALKRNAQRARGCRRGFERRLQGFLSWVSAVIPWRGQSA